MQSLPVVHFLAVVRVINEPGLLVIYRNLPYQHLSYRLLFQSKRLLAHCHTWGALSLLIHIPHVAEAQAYPILLPTFGRLLTDNLSCVAIRVAIHWNTQTRCGTTVLGILLPIANDSL